MYCTNCWNEQKESSRFCHNCGSKQGGVAVKTKPKLEILEKVETKTEVIEKPVKMKFYSVPVSKYIVLSIFSFGLYDIFLFAKNFILIKEQEKSKIWPIARAIFGILFFSELSRKVLKSAKANGYDGLYDPTVLAIFYFILALVSRKATGVIWIVGFLTILCIYPMIKALNYNNEKMGAPLNKEYKAGEIITIVLGSIWWFFIIIGLLSEYANV